MTNQTVALHLEALLQARTTNRFWPLAILFSAPLLFAAACGDGGESGQPSPSPLDTQGTPTISGQLPQDFPEDFPLYPDAIINQTARFSDQILITLESADSRADIATFFREALQQSPWELLNEADFPEQSMTLFRFAHADEPIQGSISIISLGANGQSTVITLRFTVPESVGTPVPGLPSTPEPQEEGGS